MDEFKFEILKVNTTNSKGDSTISIYSPHYYLTGGTIIRLRDDLKLNYL